MKGCVSTPVGCGTGCFVPNSHSYEHESCGSEKRSDVEIMLEKYFHDSKLVSGSY